MKYGQTKTVKLYYTISEVVDLTGVPAHILRYWEQEFTMLRPRKNRAGNRTYKDRDIALVRRIQKLIQVECYTVEGALKRIRDLGDESFEAVDETSPSAELVIEVEPTVAVIPGAIAPVKQTLLESLREIRNILN